MVVLLWYLRWDGAAGGGQLLINGLLEHGSARLADPEAAVRPSR